MSKNTGNKNHEIGKIAENCKKRPRIEFDSKLEKSAKIQSSGNSDSPTTLSSSTKSEAINPLRFKSRIKDEDDSTL